MRLTHSDNIIGAIIPAAGQGRRMGGQGNKLLLELAGTPILLYTLKTFEDCPYIKEIVIPAAAEDIPSINNLVNCHGLKKVTAIVEGGRERQDSVARALQALSPQVRKAVVHDGARPLLTAGELNSFLEEAVNLEAAVMAVPVKDTIKKVDQEGWVIETPSRDHLKAIQTPQLFDRLLLEKLHKLAFDEKYYATDDAALLEWQGYRAKVLQGSYENIKVTTPEDLLLAEAILRRRKGIK